MLVGWEGNGLQEPLGLLEDFGPAGLVFFRRNYPPGGGPELREQLARIGARALEVLGRPVLLALDGEGGLVKRLPPPHVQLPAAPMAALMGPGRIFEMALEAGREMALLGFNLNLAPVLDLQVEGGIMAGRSYGPDPGLVAGCARAFMEGFRAAGVLTCAKHFPGLGAAMEDPHSVLPSIGLGPEAMAPHLRPFGELAASGLPMVMTSHCLYPGLGLDRPATFHGAAAAMLRGRLSFDGPILSDDLEMGAVAGNLPVGEAAVQAVQAGHDLVLVCRRRRAIEEAHGALALALASGRLDASRQLASLGRLGRLLGPGATGDDL
jgi:beta-N-acetylhexosaminidase